MRALIYHRISAADHGEPVARGLERLRRHAEGRGWEVVSEFTDDSPRHDTVRPGYRAAREQLAPALTILTQITQPEVLVVLSLGRLFPSAHAALLDLETWLAAGRHLVAVEDMVDTTRPAEGLAWRTVVEVLGRFERQRHAEATAIGVLRATLARHGRTLGPGRPTVAVDLLELRSLHAQGLSLRKIRRHLGRGGAPAPSHGTIVNRLRLLAAAGRLDHAAREAARARRSHK